MARLMATIDDDRNPYKYRGRHMMGGRITHTRVSRLANQWSNVTVKTWDLEITVNLTADNHYSVRVVDPVQGRTEFLAVNASLESTFGHSAPQRAASDGRILQPRRRKPRLTAAQKRELATVNQLFGVSA